MAASLPKTRDEQLLIRHFRLILTVVFFCTQTRFFRCVVLLFCPLATRLIRSLVTATVSEVGVVAS